MTCVFLNPRHHWHFWDRYNYYTDGEKNRFVESEIFISLFVYSEQKNYYDPAIQMTLNLVNYQLCFDKLFWDLCVWCVSCNTRTIKFFYFIPVQQLVFVYSCCIPSLKIFVCSSWSIDSYVLYTTILLSSTRWYPYFYYIIIWLL